jgi:hypothetical protein
MKIHILEKFKKFVPSKFEENPLKYYQEHGKPFRSGEILVDEAGVVRDDPTAVRFFQAWKSDSGDSIKVVAKKINLHKAKQAENDEPLWEWKILENVHQLGLPSAEPIGWVEQEGEYLILTEKIEGDHFEKFKDLKEGKNADYMTTVPVILSDVTQGFLIS